MRAVIVPLACLLLAACAAQEEQMMPVEPDGGIGDGAGPIPPLLDADSKPFTSGEITDPEISQGQIPSRYHGVWDYAGGTCAPESDARMEIKARQITFYESIGMVAGVGQDGADAIPDLMMEGEGETWFEPLRLSLVEVDGETLLHTSDGLKAKVIDEYPRKRCDR